MDFELAWRPPSEVSPAEPGRAQNPAAALRRQLIGALEAQRSRRPLWIPVALAAGAAFYFALPVEPHGAVALVAASLAIGLAARIRRGTLSPIWLLIAACAAGFVVAKGRTLALDTAVLAAPTGDVVLTGRIVGLMPLGEKSLRVRLDDVRLGGITAGAAPPRVEIRMAAPTPPLRRGTTIRVHALLYPPAGPVLPGAYDHARTLWFAGIGATGRAIGRPESIAGPAGFSLADWIDECRDAIGARIRAALPGPIGALAEAQIIGERGHLSRDINDALQVSGLAHILSISGLHMALVAGGVFLGLRALFALSPRLVLTRPVKVWAAVGALLAAIVYLALSGGGVATWRSAIMIALLFAAVLAERPALSLHNLVAAAALLIITAPESVLSASFQMSFLAVMGLIAAHEAWAVWRMGRDRDRESADHWTRSILRGLVGSAGAMLATTLVASLCSGLPAAYHFNRLSAYGLIANALALPVVSLLVMPAALAAMIAMPFGLEALPLRLMGAGLEAVVTIASTIAGMPGAQTAVASPSALSMMAMTGGLVFLCLWQGWTRLLGLLGIVGGLALAGIGAEPDIIVERRGATVAVRDENGRLTLPLQRKARFSVEKWLLHEGDPAGFAEALKRPGWHCAGSACRAVVNGRRLLFLRNDTAAGTAARLCGDAEIVIAAVPLRGACRSARLRIDRFDLWRKGAHAIYAEGDDWRVVTAWDERGRRPWVVEPVPRASIRSKGSGR
jgi:competence protein ComEC